MDSDAPPPSYQEARTGQKKAPPSTSTSNPTGSTNGIPPQDRRSMEDINRPLPQGWIRQWDPKSHHHFYVDTRQTPPRSIWQHPADEMAEQQGGAGIGGSGGHHADHEYDETTDEEGTPHNPRSDQQAGSAKPPATGMKKLGQSMKNKLTNSTHEERAAKRKHQRELEQKAYEQHQAIRALLVKASQTGQPQLVGRDKQGRDIYAQPPPRMDPYAGPQLGYTPYQTEMASPYGPGSYAAPYGPYGRRAGYGYGGGMGLPVFGGLAGGMLLGGLLF